MSPKPADGMDQAAITAAVAADRLALCELLDTLPPEAWDTPSLCAAWTVRDVVGHLTLATEESFGGMVRGMLKARGNFDRMTTDAARERAASRTPGELVEVLRSTAASDRRAPFSDRLDPLLDILVHSQDIARSLGLPHPTPVDHAVAALHLAVTSRWYGGPKRFADVRLVATDADWSAGGGTAEARGPVADLLLAATGRSTGLAALTGPGADLLRTRTN